MLINNLITQFDKSHGSKASSASVCMSVSVCLHDRTKTAETIITKLATEIVHWVMAIHLILGQKVKDQGQRVTKCKNIFLLKAMEWSAWACTLSGGCHLVTYNNCYIHTKDKDLYDITRHIDLPGRQNELQHYSLIRSSNIGFSASDMYRVIDVNEWMNDVFINVW